MDNNLIILLSLSWQIKYHQKIQYFFNFSSSTSNDDPERSSTHLQAWSQAWSKHLLKHFLFDLIISTDFISKSRLNPNLRYSHSAPAIRSTLHSVWKSQKKSHSIMRAERATFTFWVDKRLLKMPKITNLSSFTNKDVSFGVQFKFWCMGNSCSQLSICIIEF